MYISYIEKLKFSQSVVSQLQCIIVSVHSLTSGLGTPVTLTLCYYSVLEVIPVQCEVAMDTE